VVFGFDWSLDLPQTVSPPVDRAIRNRDQQAYLLRFPGIDGAPDPFRAASLAVLGEPLQGLAGLARARAQGKTLGRPKLDATIEARVRALRAAGHGINKTAKLAGVGVSAVQRIVATN
jgi:hypothetical protein